LDGGSLRRLRLLAMTSSLWMSIASEAKQSSGYGGRGRIREFELDGRSIRGVRPAMTSDLGV
ncbi:MAG: hypothetical protein WEC99_00295, partial [Halofilum sp. (in: g-proteobacteria)]